MKEFCDECLKLNDGLHIDDWELCDRCFKELEEELKGADLYFSDKDRIFSTFSYFDDE